MASAMTSFLNTPPKHSSTSKSAKSTSLSSPSKRAASHTVAACASDKLQQLSSSSRQPAAALQLETNHSQPQRGAVTPRRPQQQGSSLESPSKRRRTPSPSPGSPPAPMHSADSASLHEDESPQRSSAESADLHGASTAQQSPASDFLPTPSQWAAGGPSHQPHGVRKSLVFGSPSQATVPQPAANSGDTGSPNAHQVQNAWLAVPAESSLQPGSDGAESERITDLTSCLGGKVINLCTPPGSQTNAVLDLTQT